MQVSKWGNSLAIRLPAAVVDVLGLKEGDDIEIVAAGQAKFIVQRAPITAERVMAFVAERVSPYKKVRVVEFVESIPKSPSGKILRRLLVDRERQAAANAQ